MREQYKVYTFDNGNETIELVFIGNAQFRVDNFKFKTKADFVKFYEKLDAFKFNRDKAWEYLKQFVKKEEVKK